MTENTRRTLGQWSLAIAMFLNPFGYDILVYKITLLTHDYWTTMHILYVAAAVFFCLVAFFFRINPIKFFKNKIKELIILIKSFDFKKIIRIFTKSK